MHANRFQNSFLRKPAFTFSIFEIFKFHLLPTVDYVCFHVTVPAGIVFAVVLLHSPEAVFAAHGAAILAGGQPQLAIQYLSYLSFRHICSMASRQICINLDYFAVLKVVEPHLVDSFFGCITERFR